MLWREDLDAFLIKLDEVEDKERQEELNVNKKTSKAMVGIFIILFIVNGLTMLLRNGLIYVQTLVSLIGE